MSLFTEDTLEALEALQQRRKSAKRSEDRIGAPYPIAKKVNGKVLSYTRRHRGRWFRPEYDLAEIQFAQDTSSYLFRAIKKKVDRLQTAGWEFVSENEKALNYVKKRIRYIELATDRPFDLQIMQTAADLVRYSNCLWVKVRDRMRSQGKVRKIQTSTGIKELDPVAGYFIAAFETLEFKTKANGELKKVKQNLRDGNDKEFFPDQVVHFYMNRKPGFAIGTPEMYPALDDIALLRRIEENVEELIETSLFPVYHYKIGTDQFPERFTKEGKRESDVVRETIQSMPAGSVYVSDHRHEILSLGAQGNALRIDYYLEYFKKRVFAAIGTTNVDMGEGSSATKSTASTMSKAMLMDVEAVQRTMKIFIDHFVIQELLLEGGFDVLDPKNKVEIQFGVVDKEERRADENQQIQLFHGKVITQTELRRNLGYRPLTEQDRKDMYFELYEKQPAQQVQNSQPGVSQAKGSMRLSKSKSQPSNQHGTRQSAKTVRDVLYEFDSETHLVQIPDWVSPEIEDEVFRTAMIRFRQLNSSTVCFNTVVQTILWRWKTDEW